ncbi:hypothetical protein [Rhodobium gokarnense]|uniref:COMM domain-containing protein n=1 Tax=Rhodobium gokarnense TaxID=364296 RepID=A0ABT3H8X8_9HYPH|nr:hypothetical protein [Rhodobium gokarnense]MCW2306751.1 hypothetical protein [Rhodobium gokarnense]
MQRIMPPSLTEIIGAASGFDDELFELLDALVSKPTSTEPSETDIEAVAAQSDVPKDELEYFLSFLSFLYAQTSGTSQDELRPKLLEFLGEHGDLENPDRLAEKLLRLLSHRETQAAAAKKARLSLGFLPNLTGVASFVDLRSDFERDTNGKLTGRIMSSIPVIQIFLKTNSIRDCEREIVLQVDENNIDLIQETLDDVREKLRILCKNQK